MNIIIPMAGLGQRFAVSGFSLPKPLIKIGSLPMYRVAVDCLPLSLASQLIFVIRENEFSNLLIQNIQLHYQDVHKVFYCTFRA